MPANSADRNLLFGFLALQNNFISREELIASVSVWLVDKSRSLAEILRERRALPEEEYTLVLALATRHLERFGNDPQKSLAALSSVGSLGEDLKSLADPEIDASLSRVAASRVSAAGHRGVDSDAATAPLIASGSRLDRRFRIVRPHAKGGLGEVFVARDVELNREVALKEIQTLYAHDEENRARFVLEAEITGGLEHPGIVPVYGLGTYADGRPFYAMRFIRGDSLKEAIERFHEADVPGRDLGEQTLEFRQLLSRFLDVCNAIAYAHSRGVLHRDLKPGNIMLGPYGETLVVDWGLAKLHGRPELATSAEGALKPASASGSAPTQIGTAIGTPAFMSPEQAAGRLDLLGPASDVYSLGATLYSLLTGRVPFEEREIGRLLHQVERGAFQPPRQINGKVAAALEAICLKAMALRPEDRYGSPQTLAVDIEHWLADEPVSALREPLTVQARRWARRHRTLVSATAAAVLVGVLVLAGATVLLIQANNREHIANAQLNNSNQELTEANKRERTAKEDVQREKEKTEKQKELAESQRDRAEANLYVNNFTLAHGKWLANDMIGTSQALNDCAPGQRGWEWHYLKSRCRPELFTLESRPNLTAFGFCPDGRLAWGTVRENDNLRVCDLHTLQRLDFRPDSAFGVTKLACSSEGQRVVASLADGTIKVWDNSGRELYSFDGAGQVRCLSISPAGHWLGAARGEGQIAVWSLESGEETASLHGPADVSRLELFGDGRRLALASGMTIKVWDVQADRQIFALNHPRNVTGLAISPDDRFLATACGEPSVRLWDTATGQEVRSLHGHSDAVFGVAFSPDGNLLASASDDKSVKVWDPLTGREVTTFRGHTIGVLDLSFSPDGRRLASLGRDYSLDRNSPVPGHEIKVWDMTAEPAVLTLGGPRGMVNGIAFSRDSKFLASARAYQVPKPGTDPRDPSYERRCDVQVWNTATGQEQFAIPTMAGMANSLCFSPDGQYLAAGCREELIVEEPGGGKMWDHTGEVKIWKMATQEEVATIKSPREGVAGVAFSPDSRRLAASIPRRMMVKIWEVSTNKEILSLATQTVNVGKVVFSPDGGRIAGCDNHDVRVWDTTSGKEDFSVDVDSKDVLEIAFNIDGTRLITAGADNRVKVWDAASGKLLRAVRGPASTVHSATVSPDGRRVVSGHDEVELTVWDATTGQEFLALHGHKQRITTLAFSPDGQFLASGTNNPFVESGSWGALKLWDGRSQTRHVVDSGPVALSQDGRLFATPAGPFGEQTAVVVRDTVSGDELRSMASGEVHSLRFSSDGRRLLIVGERDIDVRNVDDGNEVLNISSLGERFRNAAYSPDGRRLAMAFDGFDRIENQGGIFLRNIDIPGEPRKVMEFFPSARNLGDLTGGHDVAFSHDGRYLASAATNDLNNKPLALWDSETGELVRSFEHAWPAQNVVFSPDGKHLASAGDDEVVKIWDVVTAKEIYAFTGFVSDEDSDPFPIAFRPDGKLLATARGPDMNVWDLSTGQMAFVLRGHLRTIGGLAFRADGKSLVSTDQDEIRVWELPASWMSPAALREAATTPRLRWHRSQAEDGEERGQWFSARFHLNRLLEAAPDDGELFARRGRAFYQMGRWNRSAADYARAIELRVETRDVLVSHTRLRVRFDDLDDYRRGCDRLLERFGDTVDANEADMIAWTCVLGPSAVASPDRVVRMAEKAVRSEPRKYEYIQTLGAALYREGKFKKAVERLDEAVKVEGKEGSTLDWLFLAMAHHRLGNADEARSWLAKASDWLEKNVPEKPKEGTAEVGLSWVQVLHGEAETLLKTKSP